MTSQTQHKYSLVLFLVGFFFGAILMHYMLAHTISYKVDQAYDQGVSFGAESELSALLNNFNSADSVVVTKEGFHFYKFDKTTKDEFVVE